MFPTSPSRRRSAVRTGLAAFCCVLGSMLVLSVLAAAVLLPRGAFPDPGLQRLYADAAARPILIGEGIAAAAVGLALALAGALTLTGAAGGVSALRRAVYLAMVAVVADVVVEGWVIVPALRRAFPGASSTGEVFYDPRWRPALALAAGLAGLVVLGLIAHVLRGADRREASR